jgi:cytochrome c biogenesis protein ResB
LSAPDQPGEPLVIDQSGQRSIAGNDWHEAAETIERASAVKYNHANASSDWLAACRSMEAVAAVEKSLQRGRTIELNQAEQTEEHAFKGVMASAGCLILMLLLVAMFVVSLLGIFLAMQFLQTVIEKPRPGDPTR